MSNDNIPDEQNGSIDLITYIRQPDTPRIGTVRMLMRMALGAAHWPRRAKEPLSGQTKQYSHTGSCVKSCHSDRV